jgi:hypothetical protein
MNDLEDQLKRAEAAQDHFTAIALLDRLSVDDPDNLDHRYKLGLHCFKVGQVERAESLFRSLAAAGYADPLLDLNLGHALKALGRSGEAAACYKRLVDGFDDTHAAFGYWSLADLKDYRFDDAETVLLRGRSQVTAAAPGYRALMLFALACAREQQGNYEQAFMAMSEANLILAEHRPFRADLYGQLVTSLTSEVTAPAAFPETPEFNGPTPIFIVGMPRSGTTLVEQILAAHSRVEATDELPFLERIGLELEHLGGYAKNLAALDAGQRQRYAAGYLAAVAPYRPLQRDFFVDKNPTNFLHVGLIKALFPQARIINVVRDPLDNAMSVFKQYFHRGNEFSYSLKGIIYYWQGYVTLMKHWEELYPGAVLHLGYESLVQDPEQQITALLDYCGLPAEPACFRFYESGRPVLTPSASQVRNPMTSRSIGSGLKYESYLKTSIPALAEIKRKTREVLGV